MESNGSNGSKGSVLLAYSGGLDTSCILAWLVEQGYKVYAFIADVGQDDDASTSNEPQRPEGVGEKAFVGQDDKASTPNEIQRLEIVGRKAFVVQDDEASAPNKRKRLERVGKKALKSGATKCFIADMRREFVTELIFPAIQANCIYENVYLLGTSLARPVIARGMIAVAEREGCEYVSHGCTGKGNDQVRFELAFYGLKPDIKVIAPWRLPEFYNRFSGRQALLDFADKKQIPVQQTTAKPWSTDENLFHISYEAGVLEDPKTTPPADMWKLTQSIENAPSEADHIAIQFKAGLPVKLTNADKTHTDSVDIFLQLNELAQKHGIGRVDIVENRFIGVKSRGCYESPGATILRVAHMDLEGLTLDRNVRALRDQFITVELSRMLYNGHFFTPECEFIMSAIPASQRTVNGVVRLKLLKGNVIVEGRCSDEGLYDERQSSMDELGGFEPTDTTGFIQIESIRIKKWAQANARRGQAGVEPKDVHDSRV